MSQTIQVAAALAILISFAALQRGVVSTQSLASQLLNLVGGAVLAVDAYLEEQWGSWSCRRRGRSAPRGRSYD